MVSPDHAGYVNEILAEIFELNTHDSLSSSHRKNLLDDFSYRRLVRKAESIRDTSDKLAVKALLRLNHDLNLSEAMKLFNASVVHANDDFAWVNMVDQLAKRGFFRASLDVATRAIEHCQSIDILSNALSIAILTHNIQLMKDVQNILRRSNMRIDRTSNLYELAKNEFTEILDFNSRIGVDNNSQSQALADVLDVIANNGHSVIDVNVYTDSFFETLPVRVKVHESSIEKIVDINESIIDFIISKNYDRLKLSILIEGVN